MLYILIALTPLSPLMLNSALIAHAVTGECSGECEIDGCPLESRSNHTCCCWQKKLKSSVAHKSPQTPPCCVPVMPVTAVTDPCCAPPAPQQAPWSATTVDHYHDQTTTETGAANEPEHNETTKTVFKCGSPCGKNKVLALVKLTTDEIIPYHYTHDIIKLHESKQTLLTPESLTSRLPEPPEPPPRLEFFS